jgi:acetolactate synthase-1/2/3 large subunit
VIANGVDTVFGLPGAQTYPVFDAMSRLGVNIITTRHEQATAYMAMGYAKALAKPGVFSVVPGPGILNTGGALCTAMGGNTPMLGIVGQVPSTFLGVGRGHLHELPNQVGTLKSFIKDAWHIGDPKDASKIVNNAFRVMQSGRPGPVCVEMCWDTMAMHHEGIGVDSGNKHIDCPEINEDEINAAVEILSRAKKPLIMCGGGAQHASTEVLALAELLCAPVTAMRSGRGVVSEDHELGVSSVAGRHLYEDADVLLGIGSRMEMVSMRWQSMQVYAPRLSGNAKTIRIDIDPSEMKRLIPDVGVVADSAQACRMLVDKLGSKVNPDKHRIEEIANAKSKARRAIESIQPQIAYLDIIRAVLPRDGLFVPEVSQVGFSGYFGFPVYKPRTYISEGFQGTLGYGFQTALGVKVACPDKAVVSVNGDGGFMFGVQELATAAAHDIGLISLVFNNNAYGNVRRDQITNYEGRIVGSDLLNPDFLKLAEAFGVDAYNADSPEALKPVLEKAIEKNKPALINIDVKRGSEVSPWEFIFMDQDPCGTDYRPPERSKYL